MGVRGLVNDAHDATRARVRDDLGTAEADGGRHVDRAALQLISRGEADEIHLGVRGEVIVVVSTGDDSLSSRTPVRARALTGKAGGRTVDPGADDPTATVGRDRSDLPTH